MARNPHNINWFLPLHETTLESDRLASFKTARRAGHHPPHLSNLDRILTTVEPSICSFSMGILFAIIEEVRLGALAGIVKLVNASPAFLKIEIACAVVFSTFQHTCVTGNTIDLFLNYCLESPRIPEPPRLKFVCMQSTSHRESDSSCAPPTRMGVKEEGVMWWTWVLLGGVEENGWPILYGMDT